MLVGFFVNRSLVSWAIPVLIGLRRAIKEGPSYSFILACFDTVSHVVQAGTSLCNQGKLGISALPVSTSPVLRLHACTTMLSLCGVGDGTCGFIPFK